MAFFYVAPELRFHHHGWKLVTNPGRDSRRHVLTRQISQNIFSSLNISEVKEVSPIGKPFHSFRASHACERVRRSCARGRETLRWLGGMSRRNIRPSPPPRPARCSRSAPGLSRVVPCLSRGCPVWLCCAAVPRLPRAVAPRLSRGRPVVARGWPVGVPLMLIMLMLSMLLRTTMRMLMRNLLHNVIVNAHVNSHANDHGNVHVNVHM